MQPADIRFNRKGLPLAPEGTQSLPVLRVAFDDSAVLAPVILRTLKKHFDVVEDSQNPQIVFFGNYGWKHLERQNCVKVLTSTECVAPDFNVCDYAISNSRMDFNGRNLFLPPCFSLHLADEPRELAPPTPEMARRKFCSFLYSQRKKGEGSRLRARFCERLMEYKRVDCPGKVLHNIDVPELSARLTEDWNASKLNFIGQYKFNIAFENCDSDGYITEKLTDCFLAGTVPIYRGSEGNLSPFPKEAVICAHDYPDMESLLARVKEVDENDEEYLRILSANPLYHGFRLSLREEFESFLLNIADTAHCPKTCDPVYHSDIALWRELCGHKSLLLVVLLYTLIPYLLQRVRLLMVKDAGRDELVVINTRTKWLSNLLIHHLLHS